MSGRANALRMQVETALAGRVASPFEYRERRVETVAAGVPEIDRLTGGLPRGALTEICGPAGSGRTSVLMAAMAARMEAGEACALVDARDAFDPHAAAEAGVRLEQLLWVRCRNVDQALRAADLLIQGGGFGLIALDLGDTPARVARAIPLPVWFRMRRAVENTPTILMAVELESNAKTCASLVLRMEAREARWAETSGIICGDEFEEEFEENARRSENERADEIGENPHPLRPQNARAFWGPRQTRQGTPFDWAQGRRHPEQQEQISASATAGEITNRAWGSRQIFCEETSCEPVEKMLRTGNERAGDAPRKPPPPPRRASSKIEGGAPRKTKSALMQLAATGSDARERDGRIFLPYAQGCLFEGAKNYAEVMRSRAKKEGDRLTWREEAMEGTEFETRAI
jgi:recombination protein RecA